MSVEVLKLSGNRSDCNFTIKEWLTTNKATEIDLKEVLENWAFTIATELHTYPTHVRRDGQQEVEETEDEDSDNDEDLDDWDGKTEEEKETIEAKWREQFNAEYEEIENLAWVDQKVAAQIIVGKLLQLIHSKPQEITVEMLNNAEVVLNSYGIDFRAIKYLYEEVIDGMIENALRTPGYVLPTATDQTEFNRVLVSKLAAYVIDHEVHVTINMIENVIEFTYQLDDVSACTMVRGLARVKYIRDEFLKTAKWLEWCKIYKTIVLCDEVSFRANERFSGREENTKVMAEYFA